MIYASWMTVGMIAFSRNISFDKKSFVDRHIYFFVIGIWVYAVGLFLLLYADLKYVRLRLTLKKFSLNPSLIISNTTFLHTLFIGRGIYWL